MTQNEKENAKTSYDSMLKKHQQNKMWHIKVQRTVNLINDDEEASFLILIMLTGQVQLFAHSS